MRTRDESRSRNRAHPWRASFARDLALRPTETEPASGDVLAAGCSFCAVFGREPRVNVNVNAEPAENPKRTRARTRNVASWTRPFRPDNIRAHHAAQHASRWQSYRELLARGQKHRVVRGFLTATTAASSVDEEDDIEWMERLTAFFEGHEVTTRTEEDTAMVTKKHKVAATSTEDEAADDGARSLSPFILHLGGVSATSAISTISANSGDGEVSRPLLLTEIATPAIVEMLVDNLQEELPAVIDTMDNRALVMTPLSAPDGSKTTAFVLKVDNQLQLATVQRLLSFGLSFQQIARTLEVPGDIIRDYARLSVAVALQLLTDRMRQSWTYSLAFQVLRCPASSLQGGGNAVLQVSVRFPTPQGVDVADVHMVALPLLRFEQSVEQAETFLTGFLDVLDPNWTKKLLGGSVNGAANDLAEHVALLDRVMQRAASSCLYRVWRPAQITEASLRRALGENFTTADADRGKRPSNEGFAQELTALVAFLRGYEPWTRVHGRCPELNSACPWSTLKVLQWVLNKRSAITELFQQPVLPRMALLPPPSFWLIAFVLVDTLSIFETAASSLESFPLPSRMKCVCTLARCVKATLKKCKIIRIKDTGAGGVIAAQRPLRLEGDDWQLGLFCWTREAALVPYLRSLNVSTRRLYSELAAYDKNRVEQVVAGFVLTCLQSVGGSLGHDLLFRETHSSSVTSSSSSARDGDGSGAWTLGSTTVLCNPPPALPLDFVTLERIAAVDLIEQHSDRLSHTHDLAFMDSISSEIEQLRALVSGNPSLRLEIEQAQAKSFRCAWDLVPQLHSLRIFAAGLASVLPRTEGGPGELPGSSDSSETMKAVAIALQGKEEDRFRTNLGDLGVEARLHTQQAQLLQQTHAELEVEQVVI